MDREIELKFLVAPQAADDILARLQGQEAIKQLDATYFDTADHALRRAGFGLRVRDGEGGRKQTLKSASAGGVFARGEWESVVDGPEPDRDLLAKTPARHVLNGDALTPVFATHVRRVTRMIKRDGAVIEAALDQGELLAGTSRAAVCELELELKAGASRVLFDLARDLSIDSPLRLSLVSKAERGYALALGEAEAVWSEPPLDPECTVAQALQALGRSALDRLCAAAEALRTHPGPERIHKLRVAARRFRTLLSTFKPLAKDPAAQHIKAELKWIAGALGDARDLDIFVAEVWRPAAEGTGAVLAEDEIGALPVFGRALLSAQAEAYARAGDAVDCARFRALTLEAAAWLEAGAWTTEHALKKLRGRAAAVFAGKVLEKARGTVCQAGRDLVALSREDRHHLRLHGKRLRYAVEDLLPLFPDHPKRAAHFLKTVRDFQDALGTLNDLAGREALARGVVASSGLTQAALAADRLIAGTSAREIEQLQAARLAYEALAEAKPFW